MKVLFHSRSNLYTAPGGDLIQMEKTKEYLQKLGVEVDIFRPDLDVESYDIIHLFNLMNPQDIYDMMQKAKKHNIPVVLSTIYGLYTEFERKARGGVFQQLARHISPYQIEYVKNSIRHIKENRFHKGVQRMMYKGFYPMMKEIVDNTSVFLPNSESEMLRVAREFNLNKYKYVNVPNAVDLQLFNENVKVLPEQEKFKDSVICVARIEGRKSTLNVVKAMKDLPYNLFLIGKASHNQGKYVENVRRAAQKNVELSGTVPHENLPGIYKAAKVHVLASWMETPGLSSLEAAAMGCNIVATRKGDTYDYFGDYAFYCEPDDVNSIRQAIEKAHRSPVNPELAQIIKEKCNWEITAKKTLEAYQMALSDNNFL
ncbi:MAG: glycosyltransferase family 4 protein [Flavobacteriaceae bacterium]|nr:glycosyltransferase family 4 protein [Flavobacteriaceae bacterium]